MTYEIAFLLSLMGNIVLAGVAGLGFLGRWKWRKLYELEQQRADRYRHRKPLGLYRESGSRKLTSRPPEETR